MDKDVLTNYSALWTNKEDLDKASEIARVKGIEYDEEGSKPVLLFDLEWTLDELYVDNLGKCSIEANGDCSMGNLSISIPVTNNLAKAIIEVYMKRVARMKTMLEAAGKLEEE